GTNGIAYSLYMSTNLSAPLTAWTWVQYVRVCERISLAGLGSRAFFLVGPEQQPNRDLDYDGICDEAEVVDLTDPANPASVTPVQLASWRFDTSFASLQGQAPISYTN